MELAEAGYEQLKVLTSFASVLAEYGSCPIRAADFLVGGRWNRGF